MIPSEINIFYDSKCSIFTHKQFPIELKTLDGLDINISLIFTDTPQINLDYLCRESLKGYSQL